VSPKTVSLVKFLPNCLEDMFTNFQDASMAGHNTHIGMHTRTKNNASCTQYCSNNGWHEK